MWLWVCMLACVAATPVIGEISGMTAKEHTTEWGSQFMGDKGAINSTITAHPEQPASSNWVPEVSPNDPGVEAYNVTITGTEHKLMSEFGYGLASGEKELLSIREQRFLSWVEENGLQSPCVTIAHFPHPMFDNRTVRGLGANCSTPANQVSFRIPTKLIITSHRLENSPVYDQISEIVKIDSNLQYDYDHIMLTLFVLLELQATGSFWKPYLDLLPSELLVPMETDAYGRLWFDASDTIRKIDIREKAVEWQYSHLDVLFRNHPALLPKFRHFNKALYLRAYNLVTSRSFRLDFGVHKDTLCLVPFADLMNHRTDAAVGWLFLSKTAMGFYSGSDLSEGDQLYNNYGPIGNDILLMDFGFTVWDNPYTCAHIKLPDLSMPEIEKNRRAAILATREISFSTPLCAQLGAPTPDMLFAAMVLTLDMDQLGNNITPENIKDWMTQPAIDKALHLLEAAVSDRLSEYKYPRTQDDRLLHLLRAAAAVGQDALTDRRYFSVFLRHQEKIILESVQEFVHAALGWRCSELPPTFTGAEDRVFELRAGRTCSKYLRQAIIPILNDLVFASEVYRTDPRNAAVKGPFENWDFSQDASIANNPARPFPPAS
eukprot:c9956_g1_i1.p1 GENE.c9956_g1_i1~~c9956_g1_i1.p1  ORF type:complete len:603 (+),score=145.75 c9956_g1_i1:22-1830(+)